MVRMEEAVEEEESLRDYLQSFMGMEQSEVTTRLEPKSLYSFFTFDHCMLLIF